MKITEQDSHYRHLEQQDVGTLLDWINQEDLSVPHAVAKAKPEIQALIEAVTEKMLAGGRLFYIGSGTSGRLGIVDASECAPTYGVPQGLVIGIIAGGDAAIREAQEGAEDHSKQGWFDLQQHDISPKDVVVGVTASGTTPYVLGALEECRKHDIETGSLSCNPHSPVSALAHFPIEVITGPEFITGSTRMKAGTAQKLVLNMLTTTVMIQLGRVADNRMVDMMLTNEKLKQRGARYVSEATGKSMEESASLLEKHGSVRAAIAAS